MTKQEIIHIFFKHLNPENRIEFVKYSKNNYFKYIAAEKVFQYFVTRILQQNKIGYILPQTEGKKSNFERFEFNFSGADKFWSDLFIPKHKLFLELKSKTVFKKNGNLLAGEHIAGQEIFLKKMRKAGYDACFMFPENIKDIFKFYLNIYL